MSSQPTLSYCYPSLRRHASPCLFPLLFLKHTQHTPPWLCACFVTVSCYLHGSLPPCLRISAQASPYWVRTSLRMLFSFRFPFSTPNLPLPIIFTWCTYHTWKTIQFVSLVSLELHCPLHPTLAREAPCEQGAVSGSFAPCCIRRT